MTNPASTKIPSCVRKPVAPQIQRSADAIARAIAGELNKIVPVERRELLVQTAEWIRGRVAAFDEADHGWAHKREVFRFWVDVDEALIADGGHHRIDAVRAILRNSEQLLEFQETL